MLTSSANTPRVDELLIITATNKRFRDERSDKNCSQYIALPGFSIILRGTIENLLEQTIPHDSIS